MSKLGSVTLLASGLLVACQGCSRFQRAKFNRGVGVEEELLLVVPFSEPKESRWYGESENGKAVIEAFKVWSRQEADPNFAEGQDVDRILRIVLEWDKQKIRGRDFRKLAPGTGIKYVLYGEIENLSLTRPGRIGLMEPSIKASYRVVDVETGKTAFEEENFELNYGSGEETDFLALDFDSNQSNVKRRLLAKLGEQIGKDLYGFYKKW